MTCGIVEIPGPFSSHTQGEGQRCVCALLCLASGQVVDAWAPKEDGDTPGETGLEVGEHEKERREDRDLWSFQRTGSAFSVTISRRQVFSKGAASQLGSGEALQGPPTRLKASRHDRLIDSELGSPGC